MAGLALAGALALAAARAPGRSAREYPLLLAYAPGVRDGGAVTYRGLEVGRIRSVALTDTGVLVTLAIERDDVVLRRADSARVSTLGLLGDKVVDIRPGDQAAAPLPVGAPVPVKPGLLESDLFAQLQRDLAACRERSRAGSTDSAAVRQGSAPGIARP